MPRKATLSRKAHTRKTQKVSENIQTATEEEDDYDFDLPIYYVVPLYVLGLALVVVAILLGAAILYYGY